MSYIINGAGEIVGHINRGGEVSISHMPAQDKWCFGCRKRLPHLLMVLTQEWYDPEFFWQCTRCRDSRTEFGS
jgi:hypothetical protein